MAWRRPGDKPLSEPMMVRLLTHICITRLQWVDADPWPLSEAIMTAICDSDLYAYDLQGINNLHIVLYFLRIILVVKSFIKIIFHSLPNASSYDVMFLDNCFSSAPIDIS